MVGLGILGRDAEVDFIISLMGTLGRPVVAFIKFGITPGTRLVVDRMISGINILGRFADVAFIKDGITPGTCDVLVF
jgi:hypothetical protein